MEQIQVHQLKVDVLLLSDHGMISVQPHHIINLTSVIDPSLYYLSGNSPLLNIHPMPGMLHIHCPTIYSSLILIYPTLVL